VRRDDSNQFSASLAKHPKEKETHSDELFQRSGSLVDKGKLPIISLFYHDHWVMCTTNAQSKQITGI